MIKSMGWAAAAIWSTVSAAFAEPPDNPIFPPDAKLERLAERTAKLHSGLTEGPAVAPDGSIYLPTCRSAPPIRR